MSCYGLLLGLGVAELFGGFARLARARARPALVARRRALGLAGLAVLAANLVILLGTYSATFRPLCWGKV